MRIHDVVMLTAAQNQAKRYEGVTVQKLTNVIADHAYIVALGDRRRRPDDPIYAPANASSLALVITLLARVWWRILSCKRIKPSSSASGRGGHPGM